MELPPAGHVVLHGKSPVRHRAVVAKVVEVALLVVAFSAVKFCRVEEPIMCRFVEKSWVAVSAVEEAYGSVLAVPAVEVRAPEALMAPVLEMEKRVVVAKAAVEEEIWKSVMLFSPPTAASESLAKGEVVPMPRAPAKVEVAVVDVATM